MGMKHAVVRAAVVLAACGMLSVPAIHAQEARDGGAIEDPVGEPRRQTYGTATTTNYVLQAYAFDPREGGANLVGNDFGARGCSAFCLLTAPAVLPSGARIEAAELEACDTDAAGEVTAILYRMGNLESASQGLAVADTGFAQTPGCAFFTFLFNGPQTVDNLLNPYVVEVSIEGSSVLTTRFQAVRLVYRLQVSPAPATASFPVDVPTTHPFVRFVEAMAAAGITGGCGAGTYCPDAAVTRGQMAVFLATALGLHFPD